MELEEAEAVAWWWWGTQPRTRGTTDLATAKAGELVGAVLQFERSLSDAGSGSGWSRQGVALLEILD